MKITDVKVETIRIPMKKPFRIAFAVQDHSLNVLVKISTDEGLWGIGEAAPFEPVTGESAATVLEALKLFRTGLIGMDPLDVEGIHRMMDRLLSGNTSAKAAVDIALYDIKGKLMGQPLYKVLGGSVNQIVTDMTVGIDTPEAMAAEARERVEKDGFTILKIKAGINPSEDIQALTLIRQAVGPNIRLRVDANQGYTVSDAVRTLKAFEELGVEAVEQCLPSWDLDGMRFVRSKVDLQVMLDESVHTPIDAAKACKIDAADIINIKLMKCGGLYPAEKINAIAEANHVQCMVGCMLETKVAIAAGPFVYCLEGCDNEGVADLRLDTRAPLSMTFEKELLNGVNVIKGQALDKTGKKVSVSAIPYYALGNRQDKGYVVWMPANK